MYRQPSLESAPKPRNPGLLSGALLKCQGKFATLVWVQTEVHLTVLLAWQYDKGQMLNKSVRE